MTQQMQPIMMEGQALEPVASAVLHPWLCSGYPTCYQGFRWYASWQVGAWDWFRLIKHEYLPRGLSTVQAIVPVYAPASDHNDVSAYIAAVLQAVTTWRAGRVSVA